ncbi:hypothetical protein [Microbispora sp. ATCC PTA-5024]|uniref:hypothetical protein n=1 Tax=Microbispora sp. ATCC PTA-5024 TaxID=316330 RepID=UPI0003DC7920|nr:hypothetical protein [Microbispora sp. ATCC PTA-5024]ETK36524.1 hypothetical protein MPTA5024_08615 [Microbispora sp. ATCC PTA-5024]
MRYQDVLDTIDGGRTREWALDVLGEIAAGGSGVRAVRHPLGFLCLPVERAGEFGVCVHVWSAGAAHAVSTTSQVHCHSWDLVSHVLYGQVRNVHAVVSDAADHPTHRVFAVTSTPDGDVIRPTGRTVRYAAGRAELFGPGDTYTLGAGAFHSSVIPEGGEAATVALGRGRPGLGDLSLGPLATPLHHVRRERLDDAETARAAELARRSIWTSNTRGG